jgi:hypothetical protein
MIRAARHAVGSTRLGSRRTGSLAPSRDASSAIVVTELSKHAAAGQGRQITP